MSFRTIGSLCKNMKVNLNEAKSNFCESTRQSATNVVVSTKQRVDNDSEAEHSDENADQYTSNDNISNMTVFKKIFKKYKKKRPLPDLSAVIDPRVESVEHELTLSSIVNPGAIDAEKCRRLGLKPLDEWKVATFKEREGLFILPNIMREDGQVEWARRVFRYAEPPNTTNMTIHGNSPQSDVLKNAGNKLRWTILGVEYDWNTKEYPPDGRKLPDELIEMGQVISEAMGMKTMKPDATIINYYPPKTALSPHVDKSERSDAPLISLSFGQSAVYLSGGLDLDDPVIPIWLRSGDVLIMYGSQRLVYHAIPCIVKTKQYSLDDSDKLFEDYINCSRINMTIRQVNPTPD